MYRLTSQRKYIVGAIKNLGHSTINEIADELDENGVSMALSTVYRSLESLEKQNVVRKIATKCGQDFYEMFDQPRHDHFICSRCHKVLDIPRDETEFEVKIVDGNLIRSSETIYYGLCKECLKLSLRHRI